MFSSPYITTREFAELARRSPETIRYWRHIGYGPQSTKRGRIVLYRRADCERWLAEGFTDQQGGGDAA